MQMQCVLIKVNLPPPQSKAVPLEATSDAVCGRVHVYERVRVSSVCVSECVCLLNWPSIELICNP